MSEDRDTDQRHFRTGEPDDTIARQRDVLTTKSRSVAGKERAAADKAAGKVPGFMRGKKR